MMPAPMMTASAPWAMAPRRRSGEPGEILSDEVRADVLDVGLGDPPGDGTGHSAVTDQLAVHRPHGADAEARRGEEDLIGGESVVDVEVSLLHFDRELGAELHGRAAADPGQDVLLARGVDTLVAHHEDVAAGALAEVAVLVEEHGPRLGLRRLHFLVGEDEIQIV